MPADPKILERIVIRDPFLSAEELADLSTFVRAFDGWDRTEAGVWTGRFAHIGGIADPRIQRRLLAIRQRVRVEIESAYALSRPIYPDTLQLVRWPVGSDQAPHADSANANGKPHPYPWREIASVIYLNDDFDGGQIHFPELDLAPPIRPGMLVFFPGTLAYLHGVRPITRGTRYTVASFWSSDPGRWDGWQV